MSGRALSRPNLLARATALLARFRRARPEARDGGILHRRARRGAADRNSRLLRRGRARLRHLFQRGQAASCSACPRQTLAAHGAVSEPTARAMARGRAEGLARRRRRQHHRRRRPRRRQRGKTGRPRAFRLRGPGRTARRASSGGSAISGAAGVRRAALEQALALLGEAVATPRRRR